eukprot:CAMPEP_0119475860 /NCGR_PEP_ID=MMETSP1344-20130328/6595_1 /TAXON_ID=236787 /ORGANISM="Florenciella parvula, Strain CCMP2471" /LENGTH=493 /DNA_ID=CAMNT_0007509501 /DNA_START=401 /DNA_END=1878 /DNA_ORIENTATION=+
MDPRDAARRGAPPFRPPLNPKNVAAHLVATRQAVLSKRAMKSAAPSIRLAPPVNHANLKLSGRRQEQRGSGNGKMMQWKSPVIKISRSSHRPTHDDNQPYDEVGGTSQAHLRSEHPENSELLPKGKYKDSSADGGTTGKSRACAPSPESAAFEDNTANDTDSSMIDYDDDEEEEGFQEVMDGQAEELGGSAVDAVGGADDEVGQTTHEELEHTCHTPNQGATECGRMQAERGEQHRAQLEEQLDVYLAHSQNGKRQQIAHEEIATDCYDSEGEVRVVDQADENAPPATGVKASAKTATIKRNAQRKNASAKSTRRDAGFVSSQLVTEQRLGRFVPRATSGECEYTCIPDAFSWILSLLVLDGYDLERFSTSSELGTIRDLMHVGVSGRGYPTFARAREVAAMYGLDLRGPLRVFEMKPYVLFKRALGKKYLLCLTLFKEKGTPPDDHTVGYDDSLKHPTDPAALGCLVCNIPYTKPTYLYAGDRASPERAIAA